MVCFNCCDSLVNGVCVVFFKELVHNFIFLTADRKGKAIIYRVKEDVIPDGVTGKRKKERITTAFKPLEQICAAKSH